MNQRIVAIAFALVICGVTQAQEQSTKWPTISQLLNQQGSRVVTANNDNVWISVLGSEGRTLYICAYNDARPELQSRCAPIT